MEQGCIRIGQPVAYGVHDCIHIEKGQKLALCILKGRIKARLSGEVFVPGTVYRHNNKHLEMYFDVLAESKVIYVKCDKMLRQHKIMDDILTSAVDYISELNERLLMDNPSIRP